MAGEYALGGFSDHLPLVVAAHSPPELARRPTLLGQVEVPAAHTPAAVLRLLAGDCADDAGREPAVRGRQV
jgi:hypothetical protein